MIFIKMLKITKHVKVAKKIVMPVAQFNSQAMVALLTTAHLAV
jgi:hypothetical protein